MWSPSCLTSLCLFRVMGSQVAGLHAPRPSSPLAPFFSSPLFSLLRRGWFCVVPLTVSSFPFSRGSDGSGLAPASLPGPSTQECAGACNRLCGGPLSCVRLSETSQPHSALAVEWGSAWGASPNRGRCQIPTVALHNQSHTGPVQRQARGRGGGTWNTLNSKLNIPTGDISGRDRRRAYLGEIWPNNLFVLVFHLLSLPTTENSGK